MQKIVVIGGGQAGAACCAKLRALGHAGPLALVGAETDPPYQRPPLSKKYLLGEMARERLFLRPPEFYAEHQIALHLGAPARAIDPAARLVACAGGPLAYDALVLATGARPRRLPSTLGGDLAGVHVIRGLDDIDALAPEMRAGARLLVVGGGYIGLEAAAVARGLGLEVVLIEAAPRILGRVACAETADYFRALHRARGVDLREGVGLARLEGAGAGAGGRVARAALSDGTELAVDLVIAGIGVEPETVLAEAAGLALENGIATNALGQTSDPAIWAAGDCASFPWRGGRLRLESVQNAIDQAEAVAANILGAGLPYLPEPWFWSDQYDTKLQIAGLGAGHDRVVVRPGAREGAVSHWYFAGPVLLAVDAINDPRAYMTAKRLLGEGRSPSAQAVADPAANLLAP